MIYSKFSLLKAGVSAVALGAVTLTSPAFAQDTAGSDVTEVVVTGQRAQLRSAQKIKRESETVVDSITATDIGALPDRSVTEALQRVVGVTIERTDTNRDPARLSGEGGGVAIRGLNYVRTELNGRDVFAAKNGRSIGFSDVSSDLMAGVDVYKNTTADQIEGAIGGTVNLRTRLPFDSSQRILAVSFDSTYGDLRQKRYSTYSATFADRWETGIGEVGLLLNYSMNEQGTRSDSFTTSKMIQGTVGTRSVLIPDVVAYKSLEWEQKREAWAGAIQWRPNDQWEFVLQGITTEATPTSFENTFQFSLPNGGAPEAGYEYSGGTQGIWEKGTFTNSPLFIGRYGEDKKKTSDVAFNVRFYPNDRLTLTADLQHVKSTQKTASLTANITSSQSLTSTFDLTGDVPSVEFTNVGAFDVAANQAWQAAMDHYEDSEATQTSARFDANYDFDSSWVRSVKGGIRYAKKDATTRETGWNWNPVSARGAWGDDFNITNDGAGEYTGAGSTSDGSLVGGTEYYSLNDFMHGSFTPSFGSAWMPTRAFLSSPNAGALLSGAAADFGWCGTGDGLCPGGGFVPFNGDYENIDPGRADNPQAGVNIQQEKTLAAYAVTRFGFDTNVLGSEGIDGNIGIRVVKTETDNGKSFFATPGRGALDRPIDPNQTDTAMLARIALADALATSSKTELGASTGEYTDVLPSLNLRLRYDNGLQFRFAASKAIVRPLLADLQGYTFLEIGTTTTQVEISPGVTEERLYSVTDFSGRGGNPDLKPLEATQFDVTAEYYFSPTGSVTLAMFHKDLKNYFYSSADPESYTIGANTTNFNVLRVRNGEKGKIQGFELAYAQFFDQLPGWLSGFGVQANYTYVKSEGGANPVTNINDPNVVTNASAADLPIEGLSRTSYNIAGMYEKYGIEARVAYNWRERYLMTTSAANSNSPVWMNDYGQIDASLLYRVTPKFKVGIQVTNLGRERITTQIGYPGSIANYSWVETDRRVALVLRGQF